MTEILLNKTKNIQSVNVENSTFIELSTKRNPIITEDFNGVLDNYELYLEERNSCKNYKLSFTIQPYMSNVLFNAFTEITNDNGIIGDDAAKVEFEGKKRAFNTRTQTGDTNIPYRYQLIRDTECSHEKLGNLTYRCGADIFNNHYLRTNDFCFIQSALTSDDKSMEVFNTIEDYVRYSDGTIAKHLREVPKENVTASVSRPSHIFNRENLEGFFDAYSNRIKDENGWIGFYNRAYANIPNCKVKDENITINKCINNRNACDFIDMFPDRTLFSFLPKLNYKKNVKEEFNWDWCLTYPCENVYFDGVEEFDFFNKYGIKIIWHSRGDVRLDKRQINRESKFVYFRTKCKHNLSANDVVRFTYLTTGFKRDFAATVLGVGNEEGEHKMYYFYVSYEDLAMEFNENESKQYGVHYITLPDNMYISRVVNGQACQYYIRKFKKLNKEYSSTLNKLAFSKTIYNDDIVQILYGDNVNVSDLKDNLGREISEIFLTIIKRNKGYESFYGNGSFGNDVEGSSCFGKVTAGFNFETYEGEDTIVDVNSVDSSGENMVFKDYNIRTTYNMENFGDDVEIDSIITNMELPTKSKNILNPNGITIDDDVFYGDFVEFSPSTLFETVIEDVYHRFNTAQREYKLYGNPDGFPCNFTQLMYDEIDYGDFDFVFTGDSVTAITTSNIPSEDEFIKINYGLRDIEEGDDVASYVYYDNIFPEGYFYKPHYRVKLREYSDIYTEDYDVKIEYERIDSGGTVGNIECYSVSTQENYALTTLDKIVILYKKDGELQYKEFWVAGGTTSEKIVFSDENNHIPDILENEIVAIFIKNPTIPSYAYYQCDGSGKYIWRDLVNDSELEQSSDIYNRVFGNGALYTNININFYLRRQDPNGLYGLQYTSNKVNYKVRNMVIDGLKQTLTDANYKTEENYKICNV